MRQIVVAVLLSFVASASAFAGARREVSESFALDGATQLRVELEVGELIIEATDGDRVEVDLDLRCHSHSATCERRLEYIEILESRRPDRLDVMFDGIGKTTVHKMEVEAVVRVPRHLELIVDMDIGELDITGTERDVFVEMAIGEVRLWLEESEVGSVFLDAGIGESALYGAEASAHSSRPFLIGSELEWEAGGGSSEVVVDLGIGEISVHLD